jgi:plasmid stability protein
MESDIIAAEGDITQGYDMAQLLIRRLDDDAKERLKARAKKHGRSLEAEARAILEGAANGEPMPARHRKKEKGFGTLMHERFKRTGFTDEEYAEFERHLAEMRSVPFKPVDFGE